MDIILNNISANIGINFLVTFLCFVFGYLFGSFPTAVMIGKIFFKQDPREFGSKNAGGTNAGRIWGKKWGLIVIIIDMVKTISPIWICWAILTFVPFGEKPLLISTIDSYNQTLIQEYAIKWPVYWVTAIGCIIGHCYPIWVGFRGGKGVASFYGMTLGSSWLFGLVPGIFFFIILKWKKYVSLCSIITPVIASILSWIWAILLLVNVIPNGWQNFPMYGNTLKCDWICALTITFMALITIIKHKENIKRLINGTERKIKWMK